MARSKGKRLSSALGILAPKGANFSANDSDEDFSKPQDDPDEEMEEMTLDQATAALAVKKIRVNKTKDKKNKSKRRRSSAKFLRLSGRFGEEDEGNAEVGSDKLGEMYATAIKMNAENKINASNTWSLQLIDNMDKIIAPDLPTPSKKKSSGPFDSNAPAFANRQDDDDNVALVNFQKASCTLDASVKIYSYRVDDVHTSSYKVLANLNRTDGGEEEEEDSDGEGGKKPAKVGTKKIRQSVNTLETNVSALNMNKLDSAFDIDPLFRKMSKTFDEGGAKGMLLANLSVSTEGCGIVFDSKEDESDRKRRTDEMADGEDVEKVEEEKPSPKKINIGGLRSKLKTLLSASSLSELSLVPQLTQLRNEYESLKQEGHVAVQKKKKSKRYANSAEDEAEAEQEVVREHAERSHATTALNATGNDDMGFADNDDEFDGYMAMDDGADNYATTSFSNDLFDKQNNGGAVNQIIDAIAAAPTEDDEEGGGGRSSNAHSYYNLEDVLKGSQGKLGNNWAGAAHWKRGSKARSPSAAVTPDGETKKSGGKVQSFIDFAKTVDERLFVATAPKKGRGKKAVPVDPYKQTDAAVAKQNVTANLLPHDSGVGVAQLSRLFLRNGSADIFADVEHDDDLAFNDDVGGGDFGGNDGSFHNAAGNFMDKDNYVVEMEGVRKIEKVRNCEKRSDELRTQYLRLD
ncbi:hypothetical protein TL16_g10685 [Triparma laevis f. inornata]|uniref:Condensin complex subunit 2 n=1 Tax=Triparma laevis f. inornata TaxID=1714386 RepID=A0A9W7B9P9_9STRA|nr:hypothetical protein TL16_g10685 [Triparma laevis f. inornata]